MTQIAQTVRTEGLFDIEVPGNWVLPDDQFWLAIVKPHYAGPELIGEDASRPEALALASALFSPNGDGQYPIAVNAPVRNAIVLFPEFAFGSGDFAALDAMIRTQPRPVMVFAGFGAVSGDRLGAAIRGGQVLCGWRSGLNAVDGAKRYNGAWCWIHDPRQNAPNAHRCYVLLKNWPEQRTERVGIPEIAGGTETVRLLAGDCTIYPLICADVLCNAANCPQERITASIRASHLDRNKVLVPLLMLDGKPSHHAWRARLANLIQADPLKVAIVSCNHAPVEPQSTEEDDQMRCLSGALVSNQQFSPDHREIPHPVRPVTLTGLAGYVLRSNAPGIAAGDFIWREVGLINRFIWLPNTRVTLESGKLVYAIAAPVQIEMQRWCSRVRPPVWLRANSPGKGFLDAGLAKTKIALKSVAHAESIWPEALNGKGLDAKPVCQLDDAGKNTAVRDALDDAYLIAASVGQAPGYSFDPVAHLGHFHRTATADSGAREIIIWSSPDKLSDQQFQKVQEAALNGRFDSVVVVVARAPGGMAPLFTRVTPEAMTDVANGPPPPDGDDIAEPPPVPVFWMPIGEIQEVLAREDWAKLSEEESQAAIGLEIEALLNRIAV